jgi:hypothetical protein
MLSALAVAIMAPGLAMAIDERARAIDADAPPRRFRLTRDNFHVGRTIGILFDGVVRRDVLAYDVDEGWIETEKHRGRLNGRVEPYWREFVPPPSQEASEAFQEIAMRRADDKRARKAAARAGRVA